MNKSQQYHQNRTGQRSQHRDERRRPPSFEVTRINLTADKLPTGLFSSIAEDAAKYAAEWDDTRNKAGNQASKPTQLRKFYDEVCMWQAKVKNDNKQLDKFLPFILMLKAKVAYSEGRKHVNKPYVNVLNHCLTELETHPKSQTLHNLKLFMEALTGFYKVYGPK